MFQFITADVHHNSNIFLNFTNDFTALTYHVNYWQQMSVFDSMWRSLIISHQHCHYYAQQLQ